MSDAFKVLFSNRNGEKELRDCMLSGRYVTLQEGIVAYELSMRKRAAGAANNHFKMAAYALGGSAGENAGCFWYEVNGMAAANSIKKIRNSLLFVNNIQL
jgi:hypothetical protein